MKKIYFSFLLLALLLECAAAYCQPSYVVQDAKGSTSFIPWSPGDSGSVLVSLNTGESSLSVSTISVGEQDGLNVPYGGFILKSKAKNSVSSIIKNSNFQFAGSMGFYKGVEHQSHAHDGGYNLWSYYFQADVGFNRISTLDSSKSKSERVKDIFALQPHIKLGVMSDGFSPANLFGGLALEAGIKDNTTELTTFQLYNQAGLSGSQLLLSNAQDVYFSNQLKKGYAYSNLILDLGAQITPRVLFMVHGRYLTEKYYAPSLRGGFGIYLTKTSNSLAVVGGLQYQANDLLDYRTPDKDNGQKSSLSLVAGFAF